MTVFSATVSTLMGSGAKSYMSPNMRKCANFSPYKRRPLVIYDFAPNPS